MGRRDPLPTIDAEAFFSVDLRIGRIVECLPFPEARRPAYRLRIDLGPLGIRQSSARITDHYQPEDLTGRLVVCAVNLPARQVGPVRSEVLVMGAYEGDSDRVVLLEPEREVEPGNRVG